jgi:hypothetical protein
MDDHDGAIMIIEINHKRVTVCTDACVKKYSALSNGEKIEMAEQSTRGVCVVCKKDTAKKKKS